MAPWTVVARSFRPAPRIPASQAMHLHHHGRTIHTPGKISDLPLPHIVHLVRAASTSAALKPPVNRLAPHPQFQRLRLFVQFVPIHPVPRPRQNRSPFFVRQLLSVPKKAISLNHRHLKVFPNSCGEPLNARCSKASASDSARLSSSMYDVRKPDLSRMNSG